MKNVIFAVTVTYVFYRREGEFFVFLFIERIIKQFFRIRFYYVISGLAFAYGVAGKHQFVVYDAEFRYGVEFRVGDYKIFVIKGYSRRG